MKSEVKKIIEDYNDGNILLPEATLKIRELRKEAEALIELSKKFEYENLQAYEQLKGDPFMGFEFTVVNGRKTYSFSNIQEVKYAAEQVKNAQDKAKAAFELYQKTGQRPITEDGELIELPEINYSKSYLKVTKSKSK